MSRLCFIALGLLLAWLPCKSNGQDLNSKDVLANDLDSRTPHADPSLTIDEGTLRGHVRFLADDLLEGRGPGSRGDDLTQLYIATQFQSLGLKPAAEGGSWRQRVPLIGAKTHAPSEVAFRHEGNSVMLKSVDEFMSTIGRPVESTSIQDAEVVFVGYGIQAPEYQWDDYKDVDLRGKVLLMMNNDPSSEQDLFEGRRRLYYGRWDYKYEIAARQGAAGAIIIHTTPSAGLSMAGHPNVLEWRRV